MIRKLKALSLALGAVFAMGAMMASTASATDFFTNAAGKGSDLLTGTGTDHEFSIASGTQVFECATARFAGTATHGSSTVTVDAEYNGTPEKAPNHTATEHCRGTGGHKIVVDMNGCDYDLTGNTELTETHGTDAKVWITCPAGKEIEVTDTSVSVTIDVPEQTPTAKKGGVTYTNLVGHTGGDSIEINATVTGITWTCTPAFLCGLGGIASEGNDGTYTGHVKATCWADNNGAGKPITPASEGARTGCKIS
jgi:hypothetical protein